MKHKTHLTMKTKMNSIKKIATTGMFLVSLTALAQETPMSLSTIVNQPLCYGQTTGQIIVHPIGGNAPYTYYWSNNAPEDVNYISNLTPGLYTITVKDAWGQMVSLTYEITNPAPVIINGSIIPPSNKNATDGMVDVEVLNAVGTASYSWTLANGTAVASTQDLTQIGVGHYYLNVTDENGCSAAKDFNVFAKKPKPVTGQTISFTGGSTVQLGSVYPNPAVQNIHVRAEENLDGFSVYNAYGVKVYESNGKMMSKDEINILLKSGVYTVYFTSENGEQSSERIVISE
jgi:hypothetical protein